MSSGNYGLVEAYVMRKLHKEKMKKMELAAAADAAASKSAATHHHHQGGDEEEKYGGSEKSGSYEGGGCFSLFKFKKVHASADS